MQQKYLKLKGIIILVVILFQQDIFGQDDSFETIIVPSHWATTNGVLSTSTDHYKIGDKSLKWDWSSNAILTVSALQNHGLIPSEVLGYYQNMFRMWVYNTSKISSEPFTIEFYDNTGTLQFYYDFQLNFTGWRAASASYKFEMSGNKASSNITTMKIKAPTSGSGTFYFDYIDYTMARNTSRSADYQLPFINMSNEEHWGDMMYFQTLPKTVALTTPNAQELSDLVAVKQKYDALILSSAPSSSNLTSAVAKYNAQKINYSNEIVTGVPIYGADYYDTENIEAVDEFIHVLARDYKHKGTSSSLTYFLNTVRYLLDQGFAEGSLVETVHHIGYRFRNVAKAIHLMKEELIAEGLWDESQKMVEWYTAVDIIWHPTAHESNLDDALTRSISILGACLYKTTDAERVQYLKGYKLYIQNWLTAYSKEGEGLKIDYTGFHHNTYYPQYTFGAYKSLAEAINLISGGSYSISTDKRTLFKNAMSLARVIMSEDNFPNSLSGRSPLNSISITNGLKELGLAAPVDAQLLGAYNYITGGDSDTNSYATETVPVGFWQVNYSNLGTYRQNEWVVNSKGFNKYFWGTEIYTSDNRFGRYQSYGAVEVMYKGGFANSGFNRAGWDWNKPPGTTTIHLSWADIEAVNDRQDESTNSNFAASLRFGTKANYYIDAKLEGNYGMFGMDFTQKAITSSHNATFTFKKSVFCFDGKIICLGSTISNDDSANITATNLFQNYLSSNALPINVNNTSVTTFPFNTTLSSTANNWIIDAVNTGYFIKSGHSIIIDKKNQDSPNENGNGTFTNGNFASAYINHGTSPNNLGYEYVIIPKTNASEMAIFNSNMSSSSTAFYEVIQKDETAHIVKYKDMYGYSLFNVGTYGSTTPIKSNDEPCLVMTERTGNNLNLTLVNPDLNFEASNGESQDTTITLVLNGDWSLNSSSGGNVNIIAGVGETILSIDAKDGLPVDVELYSGVYNPFYPIFYYEDFRQSVNRGYSVQIVQNTDGQDEANLGKVISDIPDVLDSNSAFTETRPENRIPNNTVRDQRAISIVGTSNSTNYQTEVWLLMTTIDFSITNPYIDVDDNYKYVSFWTEQRYANGGISSLSVLISTDYTTDVATATWTDVTNNLNQIATSSNNPQTYIKSILDLSSYNSSTFTLAFKYESDNSVFTTSNRNGTFYISDVKYFVSDTTLSISENLFENNIIIYPNPVSDTLHINNLMNSTFEINDVQIFDNLGRLVLKQSVNNDIDITNLSKGIYFLKIKNIEGSSFIKKIIIE